jgi:hypothetical protein
MSPEDRPASQSAAPAARALTLDQVEPGRAVEFMGFAPGLDPAFRDQLLAYGVQPTHMLKVLQHAPMTVIVCDHVELALEAPVARMIEVRART